MAGALAAAIAAGQTVPPFNLAFSYKGPTDAAPVVTGAGGTVLLPPTLTGTGVTVQFLVSNKGDSAVSISQAAVSGSGFSLSPAALEVPPNGTGILNIGFSPSAAGPVLGSLSIRVGQTQTMSFVLSGNATAPNLITSYVVNPEGNQTPVADGGLIGFTSTAVGQSSTVTIVITNRGSGPGTLSAVSVAGDAFKISGLPLLPATIAANNDVRFNVAFTPSSRDSQQGSLRVDLGAQARMFILQGQGSASAFTYEAITETGIVSVTSNGAINLPSAAVNGTSSVTLRVTNAGNAPGRVALVTVVGTAFQVSDLAPLPISLSPRDASTFKITFTPKDSGAATAKLLIDSALFNLQATALGPKLTLTFRAGSSISEVANNGVVSFPNTTVGAKSSAAIDILNVGNVPAAVSSISLNGTAFILSAPGLPVTLQPGQTISVPLTFAPDSVATLNGTLVIEDQTVNLRGTGNPPPVLPSFSITGVGDTAAPLAQPSVGLSLASPYPMDVSGKLKLGFTSDSFVDDPVIQFSTGGRSVDFRIPANTTSAVFGSGASQVQFQSGTVAGTITLDPSFATGSVDLTPKSSVMKAVAIASGAPQIRNVQVGTKTASSFELLITGFSTTRAVSEIGLQFTPAAGANLKTTALTVNVDAPFSSWYQSAPSKTVGSQFTASITISGTGDINAVQSVTITANNSRGASNAMSATLR